VAWLYKIPYTLTKIIDDFTEPEKGATKAVNNMSSFVKDRTAPPEVP
jgi:hypothetical protein